MKNKKSAKRIWEISSEEDILKGRADFDKRIKANTDIAIKLKERSEHFKTQPNSIPTLPTMQEFLYISHLHKLDHTESLELYRYIIESLIEMDKQLAEKLQYLEDNIQTLGKKSGAELTTLKNNMAVVQKSAMAVYSMVKETKKQEQANDDKWRSAEGIKGYLV
jgi:hypothetical protein